MMKAGTLEFTGMKSPWYAEALQVTCPLCGAAPFARCTAVDDDGRDLVRFVGPHKARKTREKETRS